MPGDIDAEAATRQIQRSRILPVVVLDDASQAPALGRALIAGGLPLAEVTFRTDAAEQSIAKLAALDDMVVGAGTVLSTGQVDRAVAAGATFIVSPGFDNAVIDRAREHGVAVFPGVATATEITRALAAGISTVKFFPAQASGGLAAIKALAAPFPQVRFIPTGGIRGDGAADYLRHPAVVAVGGSWMVAGPWVAAGRFDEVTDETARAVRLVSECAQ